MKHEGLTSTNGNFFAENSPEEPGERTGGIGKQGRESRQEHCLDLPEY